MQCRHVQVELPAMGDVSRLQLEAQQYAAQGHQARKSQLCAAILMGAHNRYDAGHVCCMNCFHHAQNKTSFIDTTGPVICKKSTIVHLTNAGHLT